MKNVLIGVFAGISVLSLGYIAYDSFIKEEKIQLKECNKEEICDECICDNENYDDMDEEGNYHVEHSGVYTKDGKIYKLDVYNIVNLVTGKIELENQSIKLEKRDSVLYANGKEIEGVSELYVTNNYIFTGHAAQCGLVFNSAIDSKLNVIDLYNNEKIINFQAYDIYLSEEGNLVAIGGECYTGGPDDDYKFEKVEFKMLNGKLEITKEKLK